MCSSELHKIDINSVAARSGALYYKAILSADINECNDSVAVCNDNADCMDTNGSFECSCRRGFSGDGFNCNGDING